MKSQVQFKFKTLYLQLYFLLWWRKRVAFPSSLKLSFSQLDLAFLCEGPGRDLQNYRCFAPSHIMYCFCRTTHLKRCKSLLPHHQPREETSRPSTLRRPAPLKTPLSLVVLTPVPLLHLLQIWKLQARLHIPLWPTTPQKTEVSPQLRPLDTSLMSSTQRWRIV